MSRAFQAPQRRIRSFLAGILVAVTVTLGACSQEPKEACTPQEMERVNALFVQAFEVGMRMAATNDMSLLTGLLNYSLEVQNSLTPSCRVFVDRLNQQVSARPQRMRPWQPPPNFGEGSVRYDNASDTYHAPGGVSCGPSGCVMP